MNLLRQGAAGINDCAVALAGIENKDIAKATGTQRYRIGLIGLIFNSASLEGELRSTVIRLPLGKRHDSAIDSGAEEHRIDHLKLYPT